MPKTLITTRDAAERLSVSVRRVQRYAVDSGAGVRIGRDLLIDASKLERLRKYIEAGKERQRKSAIGNDFWRFRKSGKKDSQSS